jgi:hypothetical protein
VITMLGDVSTDELSRTTPQAADHRPAVRTPLVRRPWVVPLGLLTVIFIGYAVPPYLTLDPAGARIQPMPPHPSYYPLLVSHIFLGSWRCLQHACRSGPGFAAPTVRFIAGAGESMLPPRSLHRSAS